MEEGEASRDLARMIAVRGYDPSVVEDGYFRSFVRRLNPEFRLPSRDAIEGLCDGFFDEARADLFSKLRRASGRVSLAVGKASGKADAIEGDELYLYTACHFIDDGWNLHRWSWMLMIMYPGLSTMARYPEFLRFPQTFMISARWPSTVSWMLVLQGEMFWIECSWWHGRAKCIFQPKDYIQQKFPSRHPRRRELICDTYMDIVLHHVARRLTLHPRLVTDMTEEHSIESAVQDLHLTRQKRQRLLSQLGLDDLRTFNERWYSCYCSLEVLRAEEGSCAIGGIDPELIGLLCRIWRTVYRAVKRISASNSLTSNLFLRELFNVREVLQFEIARNDGQNADVLRDATDTLDKRLLDSYLVWSIPLVLNPRYKLKYIEFNFRRAFHPEKAAYHISEITRKIKKLYTDYIEYDGGMIGTYSDGATALAIDSTDLLEQAWDKHHCAQDGVTSEVARSSYPEARTELDHYLKDRLAPQTEGFNILKWWKDHSSEYPTVARMARDALAMPTCSQLSSEQMAHVRRIVRGYSKEEYRHQVDEIENHVRYCTLK